MYSSSSSLVVILHCHCWCTEVIDEEINDQKSVSVHPLGDGKTLRFFLGGMILLPRKRILWGS